MVAKVLTVVPLLVLSGLFFGAGIIEGGVLFLAFGAAMVWAYARAGAAASVSAEELREMRQRSGPPPGAGGTGV
jgi:hypothetical protein